MIEFMKNTPNFPGLTGATGCSNRHRLHALDTFRGFTIALMILVNSPGYNTTYPWLEHANWNGCTLADFVFPFFLFIVGLSCSLSISQRTPHFKIFKRAVLIFAIGLLLNAFPHPIPLDHLRFLGVLQRIALCYYAAALIYMHCSKRTHMLLILCILVGYWGAVVYFSPAHLTAENNMTALVDQAIFGAHHLYRASFDPEGLLSTLPAIATTLLGSLTGLWLQEKKTTSMLVRRGVVMVCMGLLFSLVCPLNKTLWSSSYVLYTGGVALVIFALSHAWIDIKKHTRGCMFFDVFGINALAAYILHVFFLKAQALVILSSATEGPLKLRPYLTSLFFGNLPPQLASLLYAISYLMLWFLVLLPLYRRKIYIKLS